MARKARRHRKARSKPRKIKKHKKKTKAQRRAIAIRNLKKAHKKRRKGRKGRRGGRPLPRRDARRVLGRRARRSRRRKALSKPRKVKKNGYTRDRIDFCHYCGKHVGFKNMGVHYRAEHEPASDKKLRERSEAFYAFRKRLTAALPGVPEALVDIEARMKFFGMSRKQAEDEVWGWQA